MTDAKRIQVTLTKSIIGRRASHKACVKGLGLRRIRDSVILEDTPSIRGMIAKVSYLLHVEPAARDIASDSPTDRAQRENDSAEVRPHKYLWEIADWPSFTWNDERLSAALKRVSYARKQLHKSLDDIDVNASNEIHLHALTQDLVKSTEVTEFDPEKVRSSFARKLNMDIGGLVPSDRNEDAVVEMMLDATGNYAQPLTTERLFHWHTSLFPIGYSGMNKIVTGDWRNDSQGPMVVSSGPMGNETTHFQAPPAERVPGEMQKFLDWYNTAAGTDPGITAGLAHLWFLTIHPFEDGNGRISRAIVHMALARAEQSSQLFYSMSAQIHKERKAYDKIIEHSQKGELDVTSWLQWFLNCLTCAIDSTQQTLDATLKKARFWQRLKDTNLNPRQIKILNKLLGGFSGKLTSDKWAKIAKCSPNLAQLDINQLIQLGILQQDPKGRRKISYSLTINTKGK